MNKLLSNKTIFKQNILTTTDIKSVLNNTDNSRYSLVKRAIQSGILIPLRRGLYYLTKPDHDKPLNLFVVAQYLYGPSYISCESALAYHGWIPEAVPTITSACTQRTKTFSNRIGDFVYHKLPLKNFYCETDYIQTPSGPMMMAKPWKAILDYIYIFKKNWKSLDPLIKSFRIEEENLSTLKDYYIEKLEDFYHQRRISLFLKKVAKDLNL